MSRASEHAYAEIRSLILSGEAAPGSQLKEEQLAVYCGVSRTPVRDALRRLEGEMYVVRSDSQRAFVADWGQDDVVEMFTLRGMLESHAAGRAASRFTPEGLARLRECNARLASAIRRNDPDLQAFLDENRLFHQIIVDTARSPCLSTTLHVLVEQPIVRRTAARYSPTHLEQSVREHEELIQAFAASDADWAHAVMTAHLRRAFHVFSEAVAEVDAV